MITHTHLSFCHMCPSSHTAPYMGETALSLGIGTSIPYSTQHRMLQSRWHNSEVPLHYNKVMAGLWRGARMHTHTHTHTHTLSCPALSYAWQHWGQQTKCWAPTSAWSCC